MRIVTIWIICFYTAVRSHAQLYADIQTQAGVITCELNFQQTPRTVANFVSLAEGTRQWVDERSGSLSRLKPAQPFYPGIIFHRVINTEGFSIIQAGSKRGDGTDGPGYEFPDEMNLNLPASYRFDQPYCLAMANSGPNTNGSQFFITGEPIEGLEGKHTVFGKVVSGQTVVDSILGSEVDENDRPTTDVTIQSISIRRLGKLAQKFKPSSYKLPTLSAPTFKVTAAPSPANTSRFLFKQSLNTELLVFASIDPGLGQWQQLNSRWYAPSPYTATYYDITYPQGMPITGFRPILAKYAADAVTPVVPRGYRLAMENDEGSYVFSLPAVGPLTYVFTPAGSDVPLNGNVKADTLQYQAAPYHALMAFELDSQKIIYLQLGFDLKTKTELLGRCVFRIKNFVITDADSGNGFYPEQFTEIGGDNRFSMTAIK
ncbi:MAG: Peptidyl-prolyl cis-trans isomerase [Verrucomicrobiota bacterium]|jgi:peptidyl-prolyl cis-trans isomerase A (cyclophilin A)